MQKCWHYLYVIFYPSLEYQFYYGSRITKNHPDADNMYFGSSVTFAHYNDPTHAEYQANAVKVVLWAKQMARTKKNTNTLGLKEIDLIKTALHDDHIGPAICLNRNWGKIIFMTPEIKKLAFERSVAAGGGFLNMKPADRKKCAVKGGCKSRELKLGFHGMSEDELKAIRAKGNAVIADKYAKTFVFMDPYNNKVTVRNLTAFCKKNNLSKANMQKVHNGRRKSHKGWRRVEDV